MCTEVLSFCQVSTANPFAISFSDLDKSGFNRYNRLSTEEKMKAVICILCDNRIKAIKRRGEVPCGPKKAPPKCLKVSSQIINELRRLAAFQCQIFVFTQVEKLGKQQRDALVREQFYGSESKNIKGACQQIVDGDNAFKFLYDIVEGEVGVEYVLKPMFRGKQATCAFVAGVDITAAMVGRYKYGRGKEMTGRTIWDMGLKVHKFVKKAMSLIHRVDFVQVDRTGWVTGLASGRTNQQLYQAIDNGMYAMLTKPNASSTSQKPVSCPIAEMENNHSPLPVFDDDDDDDDVGLVSVDPTTFPDEQWDDMVTRWNPTNSIVAPDGYTWFGKFAFLCFGPTREKAYFAATLVLGGDSENLEQRKAGGRSTMRKNERERENANRAAGAEERGMNIGVKISAGIIAQNEESAVQQDRNLRVVAISKQIDAARDLIGFKERMMSAMDMDVDEKRVIYKEMNDLMTKIQTLTDEMRSVTEAPRVANPIVSQVLRHASSSMGIVTTKTSLSDEDYVSSLLTDG
jgi:hypothetical protein